LAIAPDRGLNRLQENIFGKLAYDFAIKLLLKLTELEFNIKQTTVTNYYYSTFCNDS